LEEEDGDTRDGSVCDRLRNLTAVCVRAVHELLGDPGIVGSDPKYAFGRERYYKELDEQATAMMRKTRQWDGEVYLTKQQCAPI
jgi:hypothetical protein